MTTNPIRVLMYAHGFAPLVGGVETYVMNLAQGLATRDAAPRLEVTLATQTPAGNFDDGALPFRVVRRPAMWTLAGLVRRADVVHLAGPAFLPMLLALLLRRKMVVEQHGYQAVCPNGLMLHQPTMTVCPGHFQAGHYLECVRCNTAEVGTARSLRLLLLTFPRLWMCRRAAVNAPISAHVQERTQLPRARVIYYGIPDGGMAAALPATMNGAAPCFAYVGRLVSEKGPVVLLHAAKRLHNEGRAFRVRFIGDGPERARLEKLIRESGLAGEVTITGFLGGNDLAAALEDVNAVVMPSLCEETAGLAAIEQMMRGRLVIVSDIGGLTEVVGEAGLKFAPGDADELAGCLRRVLDDPGVVASFGPQARRRALHKFHLQTMVDEHAQLYRNLTGGRA